MSNDLDDLQSRQNPADDVVEEGTSDHVPTQSPAVFGEEEGSATVPTGKSTEDMVEDVGGEPATGETLWDKLNENANKSITGEDEEPEVSPEDITLDEEEKESGPETSLESLEKPDEDEDLNDYEG